MIPTTSIRFARLRLSCSRRSQWNWEALRLFSATPVGGVEPDRTAMAQHHPVVFRKSVSEHVNTAPGFLRT